MEHWLLRCTDMAEEEKVEWQSMKDDERVVAVLSYVDQGEVWRRCSFMTEA